ncbi:MAG TPA: ABC transporter permease [Atribacterota bacterium]|nr:ABC transporter permease [Atribacterota bacterium]
MIKIMKVITKRKIALIGVIILFILLFISIFAPLIAKYDPMKINPIERLEPPNSKHWFGTDNFGRDIFSRAVYGSRLTLIGGFGVVILSTFFGVLFGVTSAYFKNYGLVMMRIIDVMMAFPSLILALAFMVILGRGLMNVIIAVGLVYLTRTTRIIYGLTLKIVEEVYVKAAFSEGATDSRILVKHILPNLISPIVVQITFTFAFSLLQMSSLDFLGLGVSPQIPSWGNMLSEGHVYIERAPWLLIFPGMCIALTVLSFNIVGDLLRDELDPRFRSEIAGV